MQEYDRYINPQKPSLCLYVRSGAGLLDLADPDRWIFDGTVAKIELPPDLVQRIDAAGHAFQTMG